MLTAPPCPSIQTPLQAFQADSCRTSDKSLRTVLVGLLWTTMGSPLEYRLEPSPNPADLAPITYVPYQAARTSFTRTTFPVGPRPRAYGPPPDLSESGLGLSIPIVLVLGPKLPESVTKTWTSLPKTSKPTTSLHKDHAHLTGPIPPDLKHPRPGSHNLPPRHRLGPAGHLSSAKVSLSRKPPLRPKDVYGNFPHG